MLQCPKCNSMASTGASDCPKCGHQFTPGIDSPEVSPWWFGEPLALLYIGAKVGGYRADLTRTLYFGRINNSFRRIFNIVQSAQKAGIERVRPGSTGGRVDAAARSVISKAGYGRYFVHSTGHGVGIDIHEPPWIRPKSPDELKPGMVLTVEPGIYLPGRFGVRIEDTMAVTPGGCEILTK